MKTIEVETLTDKVGILERQVIELNKNLTCLNNDIMELKTIFQSRGRIFIVLINQLLWTNGEL